MTSPLSPLLAWRQWIPVKLVPLPNGKTDKLPVDYRTGQVTLKGSDGAHNPEIWLDYGSAVTTALTLGSTNHTVGFVLTAADPFWCLDIDGALQADGTWSPLSQGLCAALQPAVIEVSQSGSGLHIWGQGVVPPHGKKRVDLGIELYTERRFIALGRNAVGRMDVPCPTIAQVALSYFPEKVASAAPETGPSPEWRGPTDDADLLRRALQSRSAAGVFGGRASFADLWDANVEALARAYPADSNSSEPYDRSSADMALASHLAFWTGRDAARIERLMRQSKLVREKWDQRDDYLVERTIGGACGLCREVLQDKPPEPPPGPSAAATAAVGSEAPSMSTVQGSTFLTPQDQAVFFKNCVYVIDAHRALVPGGKLLKPDQFKAVYGGRIFVMDAQNAKTSRNAWEAFTENQVVRAPQADGTCFRPDLPYGAIVVDAGRTRVNTWWPVEVPRRKGDPTPFLNHVAKLFPVQRDQLIILSYMAACVQHKGVKFQFAPLIQGVEGNGKTLLSRVVAEAIGKRYVFWPKASKIAKQFNGWMVGRLLYCVEDIYTSENVDVVEEMKPMITGGDGLEIESKGVDQISTEIVGNFILNTNHKSGVKKTRNDRRYCPLYCAQQSVEDLARDGMDERYMNRLYNWLKHEGGYAVVTEFLYTFPIPDEFNPATGAQRAPRSSSTEAAIVAGYGRVEQEILEAIEQDEVGFKGGWVSSMFLEKLLQRMGKSGAVPPNRRRDVLRDLGYDYHPALDEGRVNNPTLPDGGKPRLFIKRGHPSSMLRTAAEATAAYRAAQGVGSSGVPSPK